MSKLGTLFLIISIVVWGVIISKVTKAIRVKYGFKSEELAQDSNSDWTRGREMVGPVIGDGYRHLLIFLQISDLHLSIFHDPARISDFHAFCHVTVNTIKPAVVIASGDLTDAKYADGARTTQFKEEWEQYNGILEGTGIVNKTLWLDIRGNHDNFNVPSIREKPSYFSNFSMQGKFHNRSYMYTVTPKSEEYSLNPSEKYSFIAVDAALDPGPKAPWNFIGKVTSDQFDLLRSFEKESRSSNGTIWFGHYPTSTIISGESIRELMKSGNAYLCGHLHTIFGLVAKMYTLQKSGLMELELADFKENRMYRVGAFDHGLFTFIDVYHDQWPVILVTNPRHIMFNINIAKNDVDKARMSTHIRILVFSPAKLETVRVRIDNESWVDCEHIQGPLFVLKWEAREYSRGVHQIRVFARDHFNRSHEVLHEFALDDSSRHFPILSRVALMVDAASLSYGIFLGTTLLVILPLAIFRTLHELVRAQRISLKTITHRCGRRSKSLMRKMWILSTINKLFYPLVMGPIYLVFGPWFVGEMLEGYNGMAFAWGTYVNNALLPGAFSYVFFGFIQLVWFQLPFILVLSHCVDLRFRMICWKENRTEFKNNLPMVIHLLSQFVIANLVYVCGGRPELFLGSLRWWSIALGTCMWFFSAKLKHGHFKEAEFVWKSKYDVIVGDTNEDGDGHES